MPRDIDKLAATVPSGSLVPAVRRNCEAKLTSSMEPSWAPGLKALVRRHRYDFAPRPRPRSAPRPRSSGWSCRGRSSAARRRRRRRRRRRQKHRSPRHKCNRPRSPSSTATTTSGPSTSTRCGRAAAFSPLPSRTRHQNRRRRGTPRAFLGRSSGATARILKGSRRCSIGSWRRSAAIRGPRTCRATCSRRLKGLGRRKKTGCSSRRKL